MNANIKAAVKVFSICLLIVMGIYITQTIGYSFEKYVITSDGFYNKVLIGILGMLVWSLILFSIIMISPPFRRFFLKWFNADTEANEGMDEQAGSVQKGKRRKPDWQKYALAVSIIGLIVTTLFSGIIALRSFELTEQSNNIAQKSLELQTYDPIIFPGTNRIYLENGGIFRDNRYADSSGDYNFSITVLSPIAGTVDVDFVNFTAVDYENSLVSELLNYTKIETGSFEYSPHIQPINSGLNEKQFSMPINVRYYPNASKLMNQMGLVKGNHLMSSLQLATFS